jgi:acyl dehydratase
VEETGKFRRSSLRGETTPLVLAMARPASRSGWSADQTTGAKMIKSDLGRPNDFLSLEDISAGQRFISRKYELTETEIKAFARQFDPQPFHLDNTAAQASVLRGLAASGWHTASITMRLWTESIPIAGGIVGVGGTVAWLARARPGDSLEVHAEIADVTFYVRSPGWDNRYAK